MDDRSLPMDLDMESAVLGAAMTDAIGLEACLSLQPDDFASDSHREIFAAIVSLTQAGHRVHRTTVAYTLRQKFPGEVYFESALQGHIDRGGITASASHYARVVREKAELRRLIQAGLALQRLPYEDGLTLEAVRARAEAAIVQAMSSGRDGDGLQPARCYLRDMLTQYEERKARGDGIGGYTTGYAELDFLTSGLTKGQLILIAARPSIGKTAFVSRMAAHFAQHHGAVLFFSLDTSGVALMQRVAAMEARIDSMGLRSGTLWPDEERTLRDAVDRLSALPFYVDERAGMTASYIRRQARLLAARERPALIVVDYVQMLDGAERGKREENRNQELSTISRELKQLGRELECPVVALSQLNRQVENRPNKRPQLSDLRDSGGLEAEADIVIGLYREDYYKSKQPGYEAPSVEVAEAIVLKQKSGPTGIANLAFVGKCLRFDNLEKQLDAPTPRQPERFAQSSAATRQAQSGGGRGAVDVDGWMPKVDPFAEDE